MGRQNLLRDDGEVEKVQAAELIKAGWGSVSHKGPWVGDWDVRHLHYPNPWAPSHAQPQLTAPTPIHSAL